MAVRALRADDDRRPRRSGAAVRDEGLPTMRSSAVGSASTTSVGSIAHLHGVQGARPVAVVDDLVHARPAAPMAAARLSIASASSRERSSSCSIRAAHALALLGERLDQRLLLLGRELGRPGPRSVLGGAGDRRHRRPQLVRGRARRSSSSARLARSRASRASRLLGEEARPGRGASSRQLADGTRPPRGSSAPKNGVLGASSR